ncbi:hypothetical protein A9Q91_01990 [Candidatus Gracilibacteria bacterium 28_42_T64]|nr:hypothetical protein A9Q91_01990 [Candidatus Gracilibacteria bacterium 28_42_T64]
MRIFFILISSLLLISCDDNQDDLIYYSCSTSYSLDDPENKLKRINEELDETTILAVDIEKAESLVKSYTTRKIEGMYDLTSNLVLDIKCSRYGDKVAYSKPPNPLGGFIF